MTDEMSLAVFDPITALITATQEENAALEVDHTTPEGEKKLRSFVHMVRGYRAGLEKIRVAAKADALAFGRAVDKKAKELKAPFDTIITERMKPLDEIEEAKRAKAEAIVEAERVAREKAETERLAELQRREAEAQRREAEVKAKEEAAAKIEAERQATARAESERIASERAAFEAEKTAEADKQAAVKEAAEAATKLAEANAAREAESLRKSIKDEADRKEREEEDRLDAIELEKEEVAAKEARRIADRSHRSKIHAEIEQFLRGYVIDEQASDLTEALIDGQIPHVTITY